MAFPDLPFEQYNSSRQGFDTRVAGASGRKQINAPHPKTKRTFPLSWSQLSEAELELLNSHWETFRSAAFNFFDRARPHSGLAVGAGNGSITTFTLPFKETVGLTIKLNGALPSGGTVVTPIVGGGPDGEDRVTIAPAPAAAVVITADVTRARRRHAVIYLEAKMDDGWAEAEVYSASITLEEDI